MIVWHPWHDVLLAPVDIEARTKEIRANKPRHEQALRLRVMVKVKGQLPPAVAKAYAAWVEVDAARVKAYAAWVKARAARDKAYAALDKAGAAWDKACAAWDKACAALDKTCAARAEACAAWDKAIQDDLPALMTLHEKECRPRGCTWNGEGLIFSNELLGQLSKITQEE